MALHLLLSPHTHKMRSHFLLPHTHTHTALTFTIFTTENALTFRLHSHTQYSLTFTIFIYNLAFNILPVAFNRFKHISRKKMALHLLLLLHTPNEKIKKKCFRIYCFYHRLTKWSTHSLLFYLSHTIYFHIQYFLTHMEKKLTLFIIFITCI